MLIDASSPGAAADPDARPIAVIARPLGRQTNNVAEYTAVILALEEAQRLGAQEIELVLDSKLVVEQLSGRWKVRNPGLAPLAARIQVLLGGFRGWSARHEPRARNRAADALANLALDDPRAAAETERRYRGAPGGGDEGPLPPGTPPQGAAPFPAGTGSDLPRRWADFVAEAPMVGAAGERLFEAFRVGYLATVRNDGAPRVHPVSVTFHESGLYVFVIAGSPRLRDLLETGHFALHSYSQEPASGSRDDEQVMVAGRALPVGDASIRAAVASAHATEVQPDDVLFELRIDRAAHRRREQGSPVDIAWAARGRLGDAD